MGGFGVSFLFALGSGLCVCANGFVIGEEKFLVAFFGEEYERYRKRSWVGIPGIH